MYRPIEPETYSVGDMKFDATNEERLPPRKKPGPKAKPVVGFPEAAHGPWIDPAAFSQALSLHMKRHGDSCHQLHKAVTGPLDRTCRKTIRKWINEVTAPGSVDRDESLARISTATSFRPAIFGQSCP